MRSAPAAQVLVVRLALASVAAGDRLEHADSVAGPAPAVGGDLGGGLLSGQETTVLAGLRYGDVEADLMHQALDGARLCGDGGEGGGEACGGDAGLFGVAAGGVLEAAELFFGEADRWRVGLVVGVV